MTQQTDLQGMQRIIDVQKTQARLRVPTDFVMEERFDPVRMGSELVFALKAQIAADHIAEDTYSNTTYFETPETTWQMFKSRHARAWWLRWLVERRPVRLARRPHTVSVRVERFLRYPELEIKGLGPAVIYENVTEIR